MFLYVLIILHKQLKVQKLPKHKIKGINENQISYIFDSSRDKVQLTFYYESR